MKQIGRYNHETGKVEWCDPDELVSAKPKVHFGANGWATGLESDGASVHSTQSAEFNESAKQAGFTGVHFNRDGQCTFSSRAERRRYLKFRGMVDRDGGYSD